MNASPPVAVLSPEHARFGAHAGVLVIGAGACGFCAALSAHDGGANVLVVERDRQPGGTTALSIGFIPAAGTRFQRARGIADSVDAFIADILKRNFGATNIEMVRHLVHESASTIEWLADVHHLPLSLTETELYPGHGLSRMHGTPGRSGAELIAGLHAAARAAGIPIALSTTVETIFADAKGVMRGVRVCDGGGSRDISCDALILASSGFAANRAMVEHHIPEIVDATFFGHVGSQGDAVRWGEVLGAGLDDLHAYQSHGGLAIEGKVGVPWAHILRGGIQVNANGRRFSDESRNYAQRALDLIAQPGHIAWSIYDARIDASLMEYAAYHEVLAAKCIVTADSAAELCKLTGLPPALTATLTEVAEIAAGRRPDPLGRDFRGAPPLAPSYKAIKVTGALYHTQGGLRVDRDGRVLRGDNTAFANLFAGGGAARGISGPGCEGYLAGNGLLTATVLGRLAGRAAARLPQTSGAQTGRTA